MTVVSILREGAMSDSAADDAYQFEFVSIDGDKLPLAEWRGRPVLVVNTASFCGYTPQYRDLEALWRRYQPRGLVVLGVPSNDFGEQEPGSASEIKQFCETNYQVDFPLTEKYRVAGGGAPSVLPLGRHPAWRGRGPALEFPQIPCRPRRSAGRRLAVLGQADRQRHHVRDRRDAAAGVNDAGAGRSAGPSSGMSWALARIAIASRSCLPRSSVSCQPNRPRSSPARAITSSDTISSH